MIHGCDLPHETSHILKILDLYDLEYYMRNPCSDKSLIVPSRLQPNFKFKIDHVNIDSLSCTLTDNSNAASGFVFTKSLDSHTSFVLGKDIWRVLSKFSRICY